ncbi:MAG TPA: hypothetical protein DD412_03320 [Holosporales bacterium]|nr:hypothetical protein [Holosporales bacterium]
MKQKLTLKRILSLSLILGTPTVCHASADLGHEVLSNQESTLSQEEAEMQAEREVGRLWLIAMPHLTSAEKNVVTQYLQVGIQRDYEKSQQVVEKINATNLNPSQHTQQILDSIVKDIKETK